MSDDNKLVALYQHFLGAWATRRVRIIVLVGVVVLAGGVFAVRAIAPLAASLGPRWSQHDVELRSREIFNAIRPNLMELPPTGRDQVISALFEGVTRDEPILAVGVCDEAGRLQFPTKRMPAEFSCQNAARSESSNFSSIRISGSRMLVASFPVSAANVKGHFITLSNVRYAKGRLYPTIRSLAGSWRRHLD